MWIIIAVIIFLIIPFLRNLFSNQKMWKRELSHPDINSEKIDIINLFLIKDNISYIKYEENQKAYHMIQRYGSIEQFNKMQSLSAIDEKKKSKLKPSPSFKKYFNPIDLPLMVIKNNWFIIAYPDVYGDMQLNKKKYYLSDNEMLEKGFKLESFDANFFRWIINEYKKNNSLELVN